MKNPATIPGLERTDIPLLYRVHYPQHGQDGFLVKGTRGGMQFHKLFNYRKFADADACLIAAANYAALLDERFPKLTRRENAEINRRSKNATRTSK